ncbi:MAG: DUF6089 family protein [Bacteroidota bacterium]
MKKYLLILLFIPIVAQAQMWKRNRAEFLFGLGTTNFLGELGGANQIGTNGLRDFEFRATRPLTTIGYSYRVTKEICTQFDMTYGWIYGADKLTTEPARNNRNITYRSPIVETAGKVCYEFIREKKGHRYRLKGIQGLKNIHFTSYIFTGIGGFYFNPKGKYVDGAWYALKPLCTEGQGYYDSRTPYHRIQLAIPMGIGFKYILSKEWFIGLEIGMRKTFTDYMDDVSTTYPDKEYMTDELGTMAGYFSNPTTGAIPGATTANQQRGDPGDKDSYMFMTITMRYKIPHSKRFFGIPKF